MTDYEITPPLLLVMLGKFLMLFFRRWWGRRVDQIKISVSKKNRHLLQKLGIVFTNWNGSKFLSKRCWSQKKIFFFLRKNKMSNDSMSTARTQRYPKTKIYQNCTTICLTFRASEWVRATARPFSLLTASGNHHQRVRNLWMGKKRFRRIFRFQKFFLSMKQAEERVCSSLNPWAILWSKVQKK